MKDESVFLISLYDKDPYKDWILALDDQSDFRFVGTSGTAAWCEGLGVECESIDDVFGLSPRLGGKVKSLNPDIYTGVMAERPEELPDDIPFVTGVTVDLTPFRQDGEFLPGKVDIGGPSLLRASAKSWGTVTVISSPDSARYHLENYPTNKMTRRRLAAMAFRRTLRYDHELLPEIDGNEKRFSLGERLGLESVEDLRYGENPDQDAGWAVDLFGSNELPFERLVGDKLSFTNFLDTEAARRLVPRDDRLQVSVIKHANPTGWARGDDPAEVIKSAWEGDPKSAFGSVVGINRTVTSRMVDALEEYFVVGIVAPDFEEDAVDSLKAQGSTRALAWKGSWNEKPEEGLRNIGGGYLLQTMPESIEEPGNWEEVGSVQVTDRQNRALKQMWRICRWVNSNAAVLGTTNEVFGVGAGQQSRVDAVELAVKKYREFHAGEGEPLVLASDGFFPFPDNIEVAASIGVDAIVSPGGSKRDDEVLNAAEENNMGMIFTGTRCFYH